MSSVFVPALVLVACIVLQALVPRQRLVIVLGGAAIAGLWSALTHTATIGELLASLPWDVFVILVSLGVLSEIFARSRLFDRLAVRVTRLGGAHPGRIAPLFAAVMFLVSGLVNNLTALLLVLPVLLALLRLTGTTRRHLRWTVGPLIVACNLGGASTPVGDFPAVLLLGAGAMRFGDYLRAAFPAAAFALVVVLAALVLLVRPARDVVHSSLSQRLTVAVIDALYRNVRIERRVMAGTSAVLVAMIAAWMVLPSYAVTPELVAWTGAALALALLLVAGGRAVDRRSAARDILSRALDAETTLFLFALFFMVGVVRRTGLFQALAQGILALPVGPEARLLIFLVAAGLLTGLFSAGPSMAALLEVARELGHSLPPAAVYVGLAMSVCAGSSLLLTAATAGPLAQSMVERAKLRDPAGEPLAFGFADFLPVGIVSFAIIQGVAVATGLVMAR